MDKLLSRNIYNTELPARKHQLKTTKTYNYQHTVTSASASKKLFKQELWHLKEYSNKKLSWRTNSELLRSWKVALRSLCLSREQQLSSAATSDVSGGLESCRETNKKAYKNKQKLVPKGLIGSIDGDTQNNIYMVFGEHQWQVYQIFIITWLTLWNGCSLVSFQEIVVWVQIWMLAYVMLI